MLPHVHIDEARLHQELTHLATFTAPNPPTDHTAVTRIVFTPEDIAARTYLKQLAQSANLEIREDPIGNTFYRWQGTHPDLPPVATGSHIDAIPNAGMYDGTVGVLGGLEAIRALQTQGFQPKRSIDLILFTSEEPTRFGIGCLGSRMLSGSLTPQQANQLTDPEGNTLDQARTPFTGSLDQVALQPGTYAAFIELHIEQGPDLERKHLDIGIVTGIAAPASATITIEGQGGHAGALLMPLRHDALTAAAELILAIESAALATQAEDTVATVGICTVFPGAVNSVPSRVQLSLDVRDIDLPRRDHVLTAIASAAQAIATKRGVTITTQTLNADAPTLCAPEIIQAIHTACRQPTTTSPNDPLTPYQLMPSRAYHDSLFMARICPVGMIFIPSRAGISHRPDEYSTPTQIATGTRILAQTLATLSLQ